MLSGGSLLIDRLAVIGAVGNDAGDPSFHCRQQSRHLRDVAAILVCQDVRHDLTRFGIDSQMQLAPLPWLAAVLLGIPLALTEDLQAGAVDYRPVTNFGWVFLCGAWMLSLLAAGHNRFNIP